MSNQDKTEIEAKDLERILNAVETLQNPQSEDDYRNPLFLKEAGTTGGANSSAGIGLQVGLRPVLEEVNFDFRFLEQITLGMITEYSLYAFDKAHRTALLKNSSIPRIMTLDRPQHMLPEYLQLKTVPISENEVTYYFKNPLNVTKIKELFNETFSEGKIIERKNRNRIPRYDFIVDEKVLFTASPYAIHLPYRALIEDGKLEDGLRAAAELVTRIHQDRLTHEDIRNIAMHEYQPIFKQMDPARYEDVLSDVLKLVQKKYQENKITTSPEFRETLRSKISKKERMYALSKDWIPEHIEYILACPEKSELYIKFGPNIDFEELQKRSKNLGYKIQEGQPKKIHEVYAYKKGAGKGFKTRAFKIDVNEIIDPEGNIVATLEGKSAATIKLNQDSKNYEHAAKFMSVLYYDRIFNTGMLDTAELKSDLSPFERQIIKSLSPLVKNYNFFLSEEEQRKVVGMEKPYSTEGLDWIARTMSECTSPSIEEKTLYVINRIDERASEKQKYFSQLEAETSTVAITLLSQLKQLKGRFESYCMNMKK